MLPSERVLDNVLTLAPPAPTPSLPRRLMVGDGCDELGDERSHEILILRFNDVLRPRSCFCVVASDEEEALSRLSRKAEVRGRPREEGGESLFLVGDKF